MASISKTGTISLFKVLFVLQPLSPKQFEVISGQEQLLNPQPNIHPDPAESTVFVIDCKYPFLEDESLGGVCVFLSGRLQK